MYADPVIDTHRNPRRKEGTMNVDMTEDHDVNVTHQVTLRTMTTVGLTNVVTEIIANGKINKDRTHNPTSKCHLRHPRIHSSKQDMANNNRTIQEPINHP